MKIRNALAAVPAVLAVALLGAGATPAHAVDSTPPQVNLHDGLVFRVGSVLSDSSLRPTIPAKITWRAFDDTGITAQYGEFYNDYAGTRYPALSSSARRWTDPAMPLGPGEFDHYSYAYLEAFDAAGNWSNDSESYYTQLVQQSGMNLGAGWTTSACDCWSGGSVVKSTRVGASAQYQFTGSSVAVVGDYAPNRGTVHVYIDGRLQKSVNTARAINKTRVVIYQRRFNTSQTHTIKLVVGSGRVDVDALIIQR